MSRRIVAAIVIVGAIAMTPWTAEASTLSAAGSKLIDKAAFRLISRSVKGSEQGIACLSTHLCVLVGSTTVGKAEGEVVVVRDGVPRHIGFLASTPTISSVSCPGRAGCVALGQPDVPDAVDFVAIGSAGMVDSSKRVNVSGGVSLDGIWCARLTSCVVAGNNVEDGKADIAVGTWNGRNLTLGTVVVPGHNSGAFVQGLSCFGTSCAVVGYEPRRTADIAFALMLSHGRPGKLRTLPGFVLQGVSCVSRTRCYAAGLTSSFARGVVLTLSAGRLQSPHVLARVRLSAISCGGGGCTAAGQEGDYPGPTLGTLVNVFAGRPTSTTVVSQSGGYFSIARLRDFIAAVGPARGRGFYSEVTTGS